MTSSLIRATCLSPLPRFLKSPGNCSGFMTTTATSAMTRNSGNPMLNMASRLETKKRFPSPRLRGKVGKRDQMARTAGAPPTCQLPWATAAFFTNTGKILLTTQKKQKGATNTPMMPNRPSFSVSMSCGMIGSW